MCKNSQDMNWDDLRIFLALARCETLSEAGRRLKVDHATVARRIKALEKALQTQLFNRGPMGYALTASGAELLKYATDMEAISIAAESTTANNSEKLTGTVRIAASEGIAAYGMIDPIQRLCQDNPRLKIELLTNAQRYSLAKREADFVISMSRPERGRLKIQKIADVTMHFYATKDYLKDRAPIKSADDLLKHRGIAFVPDQIPEKELDYRTEVDADLEAHITATGVHVQQAAIVGGAGIGIMHDFMADAHPHLVKLIPHKVSFKRTFWGMTHMDQENVRRVQVVSRTIVDHLRKVLMRTDHA